ncbi:phosphoglycolate phosphatase [Sphingomonas spermidinifaciens]|uniref:phosphoglycolate phosphatase n=1 Tax=Sphingomonas spermidinifaciens TaxID=1141889 RepID=A0A2A4B4W8_9SPHN|nr:HAD-IA family hydrolase [Sphingomonas spermidinifaciens]PCD03120.1 phosphoglycolate phosphatase [Sphingomonas spermidinifaciens]
MTDFSFDIVGFDLDGTLFDTSADLTRAVNHALSLAGRPPLHVETVKPMVGRGSRHMLAEGLRVSGGCDEAALAELLPELLAFYEANISEGTVPYPGMLDALDALAARGVRIGIVTNKLHSLADKLVRELGLSHRFEVLLGGDSLGPGQAKPSPALIHAMIERLGGGRAAFVGDSIYDVGAAHAAGIPAIAVSFGFLMQPVDELGADAIIHHFDELVPTLERLG